MAMSIVQFQDPTGEVMVARVPPEGTAELTLGSELLVQEGQLAVFYRDGRPTDGFKPGRYTLNTRNIPVLSKLLNLATYGGQSPFRAYVYFLHLKTFTDLGWGTATPLLFRDSELKAVHVRAHGVFSLRLGDPKTFLRTIVGTKGFENTYAVEQFVRRIIVSRFAKVMSHVLDTVLDLPAHYDDIGVQLKKAVRDDLAQYGLELVDLLVEAISVPDEVQDMINRSAGTRTLDDAEIERYKQMGMTDALRDSAKQGGTAGGGMAAGMGIGAGLGMAQDYTGKQGGGQKEGQKAREPGTAQVKAKLRELKELLEEDLITEEEFKQKKKKLLDQL